MENGPCCTVHNVNATLQCAFVKNNSDCQDVEGFLNYLDFVYCDFSASVVLPIVVCTLWMTLLFLTLGTTADDFFCPSLEVISKVLKLSQNVAGVTFLAFGNGAPDIFSSLAGMSQTRPELVIGSLFGAGVFVTCVVAGSVILVKPFRMMERPFLRDVIFYLAASFWAFYLFYAQSITFYNALGFIVLYVVYIAVVLIGHHVYQNIMKPSMISNALSVDAAVVAATVATPDLLAVIEDAQNAAHDIAPWGGPPIARHWSHEDDTWSSVNSRRTRSMASIAGLSENCTNESTPLLASSTATFPAPMRPEWLILAHAISPVDVRLWPKLPWWRKPFVLVKSPLVVILKLTIPVVDYDKCLHNWCRSLAMLHCVTSPLFFVFSVKYGLVVYGGIPLWSMVLVAGLVFAVVVFLTSTSNTPPKYHAAFAFLGFTISVVWIYLIANEIVSVLKMVGVVAHLSDAILGLTVLAWGNSLGDLIADVSIARQGSPRMGISACFGGPLFNLLLGIGIPFTYMAFQQPDKAIRIPYQAATTILSSFLFASLASSLVVVPLMKFQTSRFYGAYLYVLYIAFLIVSILNELEFF